MLVFAYGSNMDWTQMKERCPSADFIGVALLPDHSLEFTRRSKKRECGVADAVARKESALWGVVFELDESDVEELDQSEGYRPGREANAYRRAVRPVFVDGDEDRPLNAVVYFAERQVDPPLPNQTYKELILAGAKHWGLPDEYIQNVLEPIEVA